MTIYDTFLFRDELDTLECRLVQMQDWPDVRHVLAEAAVDHQGHPKPLVYAGNRERFAPWADRITHVIAGNLPAMTGAGPWDREYAQREALSAGLADAGPGDWMITADVDEIPNDAVLAAIRAGRAGICEMICCVFAVDWVLGPLKTSGLCPVAALASPAAGRRDSGNWPVIPGTGHHLTWLGGAGAIRAKLAGTPHTDIIGDVTAMIGDPAFCQRGASPFGRLGHGGPLRPADVDETWPRYVWNRVTGREPCCPENWFRPR